MMHRTIAVASVAVTSFALASDAFAGTYHVYFMGGQSNMVGFGFSNELDGAAREPVPGARIYMGAIRNDQQPAEGLGLWADVTPGFGTGFKTDGLANSLSNRFGPELSFARRIRELRPGENIAIIKYAKGGSSIDDRQPDLRHVGPPRHAGRGGHAGRQPVRPRARDHPQRDAGPTSTGTASPTRSSPRASSGCRARPTRTTR
jgi:hypothetical protein